MNDKDQFIAEIDRAIDDSVDFVKKRIKKSMKHVLRNKESNSLDEQIKKLQGMNVHLERQIEASNISLNKQNDIIQKLQSKLLVLERENSKLIDSVKRQDKVIQEKSESFNLKKEPLKAKIQDAPFGANLYSFKVLDALCGIYFLVFNGEVVYIGQSINCAARIGQHRNDKHKIFDSAYVLPCDQICLNDWESALIQIYQPRYNGKWKNGRFTNISTRRNPEAVMTEILSVCRSMQPGITIVA